MHTLKNVSNKIDKFRYIRKTAKNGEKFFSDVKDLCFPVNFLLHLLQIMKFFILQWKLL